jgi:hypothetical protein
MLLKFGCTETVLARGHQLREETSVETAINIDAAGLILLVS